MTPQEALNRIDGLIANEKLFIKISTMGEIDHSKNIEALETAKQALEKQIPKKVITHTVQENCKIGARIIQAGTQIDKCPICESFISKINKHCGTCGQALDWGNE